MTPDSKQLYLRLLSHTRPYWKTFALAICATAVLGLSEPAVAAILGPLLDGSFVDKNSDSALFYSLLLIGLFVARGVAQYTGTVAMSWVGTKIIMDLRQAMLQKLINAPSAFYDQNSTGKLLSKFSYDVTQMSEATTSAVIIIIRDSIMVVGLLGFLLYTDWQLALVFFTIIPLVGIIIKFISRRVP